MEARRGFKGAKMGNKSIPINVDTVIGAGKCTIHEVFRRMV
jgi:hypothetical protein